VRHLGVNDVLMPCTPERVWKAIQSGGSGGATTSEAQPHFADDTLNQDPSAGATDGAAQ
jgi:carbon-monoxide dehydrogenase large subunit